MESKYYELRVLRTKEKEEIRQFQLLCLVNSCNQLRVIQTKATLPPATLLAVSASGGHVDSGGLPTQSA